MNTVFADTVTKRNVSIPCPSNKDPRKFVRDFSVDTQWIRVIPATGIVIASCETHTVTFDCKMDRSNWSNAVQNALVGLGAYSSTSSVPSELADISSAPEIAYIIEWEKIPEPNNAAAMTPDKSRRPIHRLAD